MDGHYRNLGSRGPNNDLFSQPILVMLLQQYAIVVTVIGERTPRRPYSRGVDSVGRGWGRRREGVRGTGGG